MFQVTLDLRVLKTTQNQNAKGSTQQQKDESQHQQKAPKQKAAI